MASKSVISLVLVFLTAANVCAYTLDDCLIEYWAGSGSNRAVVVIDFGPASYAFGYRWDGGTKYGKDLMAAVDLAGAMNYNQSYGFLNTISYDGYLNAGQNGWPGDWWVYFTSTDGASWTDASVGFADRVLSNGSWDGWAVQTTDTWPPAHQPTTPVPEPVTLMFLGIGALLIIKHEKVQNV
ncbi:MAG: hypothetical protein NTW55_01280 [Planctomycetota bacterium]|nr:hypothetical protein [Planctomycetota bacterium]